MGKSYVLREPNQGTKGGERIPRNERRQSLRRTSRESNGEVLRPKYDYYYDPRLERIDTIVGGYVSGDSRNAREAMTRP